MGKHRESKPAPQLYWGWKGRPFPAKAERIILPGGKRREDAVVWPDFCQDELGLNPDTLWKEILSLPTWSDSKDIPYRELGDDPHWISGKHPALNYRGNEIKRTKMWCQSDYRAGLRRYGYTGWQHAISYATHDVEYIGPVKRLAEKLNQGLSKPGRAEPHNHWIITRYEDQDDNIGYHSDKIKDFAENSFFVVIKFGAPRPFAFCLPPKNELGERNDQRPIFSRSLSAGTAIFVRCKAPEGEPPAANELVQHGVPRNGNMVGQSGSIVSRCITTCIPWDEVNFMAKKREEKKRSEEKQAKEVEKRLKAEHDELVKPKPADVETTALSQINPDWDMAPRGVEAAHVKDLAASIRNQGLLEPLIIDRNGLLLAGQHRFSALRHLRDEDRGLFERWFPKSQIPVLRLDIDAHEDTQVAVAAAVAENQKRQGLSRETINQFRDKIIRKLNLRSGSGRPRKGTPPLGPLLSEAFRLSPRQIRRIRNGMGQNKPGRSDRVSSPAATAERILSATLRGGNISDDEWASMPLLKRAVALLSAIGLHEEDMAVLGKWCKQPPNVREQQVDDGSLWGQ